MRSAFALHHSNGKPLSMNKHLLRLHLQNCWLSFVDRVRDLLNMAFPIFVVAGLLVGSVKFWWWAWELIL